MTLPDIRQESYLINYLKEEKGMSEPDIAEFMKVYRTLTVKELSEFIYELIGKNIYREYPVDIHTFIHDPYYLGTIYHDCIFPIWDNMLKEIYPAPLCKACEEVILSCATRCFGKGTEIMMYNGSTKKVEDIVVGDLVMGDDNTPREVLSLSQGRELLFKVYNDDDIISFKPFKCNAHHLIPIYTDCGEYKGVIQANMFAENITHQYLKIVKGNISYTSTFKIQCIGEDDFYGFELDGNHLFQLADGTIQHNSGKSTSTVISLLYELYLLMCMIDPAKTIIGKTVGSLVFAILSKDNNTVVSQIGSDIHKGLSLSPYFQERIDANLPFSNIEKKGVMLTDNILLKAGSSLSTVIGTDLYAGCLDEANMPSTKIAIEKLVEIRMQIYKEMLDRRKATLDKAPALSGILWLTSSPTDEGDVLGERIKQVEEQNIPNVIIRDNIARWEARGTNTTETFDFFMGSDTKDPCLLEDEPELILTPEEEARIIKVPRTVAYLNDFRNEPYVSIQNIAGRRTMAENSFFSSVSIFEDVFNRENTIFSQDELKIGVGGTMQVEDYLIDKDYFSHPDRPECYRYVHLDIASKKDRFGMSSVYSDNVRYVSEEGNEIFKRTYFIDFCLGVSPRGKDPVDILKILEFIYGLKKLGYPIKLVTTDSHQGELARQIISKRGIKTEYLSVEKTKEPYYNLKNLILTKSLVGFRNPILTRELHGLREYDKKIEKSKGSTDDLSDSLAGSLYSCFMDKFYKKTDGGVKDLITQFKEQQGYNSLYNTNNFNFKYRI